MRVAVFQPMFKQYRANLFEQLTNTLHEDGHELRVVFGSPPESELRKNDNVVITRSNYYYPKSFWLFGNKVHYLQGAAGHIKWANLVITEQANKHVFNYLLILLHALGLKKFAYWGHGRNRQGNPRSTSERIKRILATRCDWWFAYTDGVGEYLQSINYPSSKITVLHNSIDTRAFSHALHEISSEDVRMFTRELSIDDDACIGLYCGGLSPDKKIQFLLESAVKIHRVIPRFILLVAGGGIDEDLVRKYAEEYQFVKVLGPVFNRQKPLAFKSADVFLCPGLIGLGILDAFTAGLPVFTTDSPSHGPEIEYLREDYNGQMTAHDESNYVTVVVSVLKSSKRLGELQSNAYASSQEYSLERMTESFRTGLQHCCKNLQMHHD